MKNNELVITSCGLATSIGCGRQSVMSNITAGTTNFCLHRQISQSEKYTPLVAYVDDEHLINGINPRIIRKLDRFSLLMMQSFQQALLPPPSMNEFGIFIGNSTGGWSFVEPQMDDIYAEKYDLLSPYVATAWFPTAPQGEISIQHKISGYSKTFAADFLSVGYALEHACYLIENHYLPGAFIGGVEAPLSPLVYNGCMRSEPLSTSGRYLPFHRQSDGYLLGEGSGLIVVETQEEAKKKKSTPLAHIAGIGIANSLSEAIQSCLETAKKTPKEIQCVFLDAKGDSKLDQEEYSALEKTFPTHSDLYLTTTKTLFGGTLAADFAIQIVLAVFSLQDKCIPRGLWSKNVHIPPPVGHLVQDHPVNFPLNNIMINARNLDGSSICILLTN